MIATFCIEEGHQLLHHDSDFDPFEKHLGLRVVHPPATHDQTDSFSFHEAPPLLIDSHAHLDSERYADDREAMLARAWEAGVGAVLAIGIGEGPARCTGRSRFAASSTGSRSFPGFTPARASIPTTRTRSNDAVLAKLDSLLAEPEVIACGEIGLDYYHEGAPHDVQRGLIRQLEIAAARKRPILIHCRPKDGDDRRLGRSFRGSWTSTGGQPAWAA